MPPKVCENPYAAPQASTADGHEADSLRRNIGSPKDGPGLGRLLLWCFGPSLLVITLMALANRPSLFAFVAAPMLLFLAEGASAAIFGRLDLMGAVSVGMLVLQCTLLGLIGWKRSQGGFSAVVLWGLLKAVWSAYFLVYIIPGLS